MSRFKGRERQRRHATLKCKGRKSSVPHRSTSINITGPVSWNIHDWKVPLQVKHILPSENLVDEGPTLPSSQPYEQPLVFIHCGQIKKEKEQCTSSLKQSLWGPCGCGSNHLDHLHPHWFCLPPITSPWRSFSDQDIQSHFLFFVIRNIDANSHLIPKYCGQYQLSQIPHEPDL